MSSQLQFADWKTSRWLVGSSFSFLIPSLYAYRKKQYLYSSILIGTTFFSVNHWRKPENGWRRIVDIIYASITFTIFTKVGDRYIGRKWYGYSGLALILFFYKMSHHIYQTKGRDSNWYIYHLLFHLTSIAQILTVLYTAPPKASLTDTFCTKSA
jgi:hypothetical protein